VPSLNSLRNSSCKSRKITGIGSWKKSRIWLRLVYLDQNALIGLGLKAQKDPYLYKRLYSKIERGSLRTVVSSWHLIETAKSTNIDSATRLADFIDSLRPLWIYERRNLQKLDVQEDFFRFLKIEFTVTPRVTTKAAVIAALFEQPPSSKYDIPSRDFVKQWMQHLEQLDVLKKSIESNANALQGLRKLRAEGKLT
jgi:hypothetical protein